MIDTNNEDEIKRIKKLNQELIKYAIERGGTCTGEHGVGIGKKPYQILEHGTAFEFMKKIKDVFDPKGILNPGKIF